MLIPLSLQSLVLLAAGVLGGLAMAAFGLFAGRVRREPRCPSCGYSMIGATGLRCSECGQLAASDRALYRRRPRWRWAIFGLLLAVSMPGFLAYRHHAGRRTQAQHVVALTIERARGLDRIESAAVGDDGRTGDFYYLMQVLIAEASLADFEGMLREAEPAARVMGMACLAKRYPTRAAEVLPERVYRPYVLETMSGCIVGYQSEGDLAYELLRDATCFDFSSTTQPLLSEREFLALDLQSMADDRGVSRRWETADRLRTALAEGRLVADLSSLRAAASSLGGVGIIKAVGRLQPDAGITRFLIACLDNSDLELNTRLAAASALTLSDSDEALAALHRHRASLDALAPGDLGSKVLFDAFARQDHEILMEPVRAAGWFDALEQMRTEVIAAFTADHPAALPDLLDALDWADRDEEVAHVVVNSLLAIAKRLREFEQPWNVYSDSAHRIEQYCDLYFNPRIIEDEGDDPFPFVSAEVRKELRYAAGSQIARASDAARRR